MQSGPDQLSRRIEALRANRTSGASGILSEALEILFAARAAHINVQQIAEAICQAQPTMAPVWNAAAAAVSPDPERLNQFAERVRRAPAALARFAASHFADDASRDVLHVVTISSSGSVVAALTAILTTRPLRVSCSESRPALEGRRLASDLSQSGIPVTYFTDAAIAHALGDADAVLVGADAVAASCFLNKSGTRMLAAAASQQGVPVYVVASRDKFIGRELAARLVIRRGAPGEVWDAPPPGVDVQNPYFESIPLDFVTAVISDVGILGTGMVPDVCEH